MKSLSHIKDIGSLEELSKYYDDIRKYTYTIFNYNNTEQLDDIIQDVFIKMHNMFETKPPRIINGAFVATAIRNTKKDADKQYTNRYLLVDVMEEDVEDSFESEYILRLSAEKEEEQKLKQIEDIVSTLKLYDQQLFAHSKEMTMKELSRKSGINYKSLCNSMSKIRAEIKNKTKEQ